MVHRSSQSIKPLVLARFVQIGFGDRAWLEENYPGDVILPARCTPCTVDSIQVRAARFLLDTLSDLRGNFHKNWRGDTHYQELFLNALAVIDLNQARDILKSAEIIADLRVNLESSAEQAEINYWGRISSWTIAEIALLAMNIDPRCVIVEHVRAAPVKSPVRRTYFGWVEIFLRGFEEQSERAKLDPIDVLEFCERMGFDFPKRLGDEVRRVAPLRGASRVVEDVTDAVGGNWSVGEGDQPPSKALTLEADVIKDVGARERTSMLRLILGMAIAGYKYNPESARSNVISEIESDLQNLDLNLTAETIRKYLREAAELLPGDGHS